MRYISWSKLTRGTAAEALAYLAEGPVTVEVDGRILMVLRASEIVQEAKNRVPAASNETRVASNEAREAVKQIVQETTGEASGETAEKAVASGQNGTQRIDPILIPGVYRGIGNLPRPPEPSIIQAVRYVRGQHYAPGTKVAVYNRATRQTEIRIAPELDADGQAISGG